MDSKTETVRPTLYELWYQNNLPVRIHDATEYIFNARKYGASGHIQPLEKDK